VGCLRGRIAALVVVVMWVLWAVGGLDVADLRRDSDLEDVGKEEDMWTLFPSLFEDADVATVAAAVVVVGPAILRELRRNNCDSMCVPSFCPKVSATSSPVPTPTPSLRLKCPPLSPSSWISAVSDGFTPPVRYP
jgi:hypothetical protein